MEISGIRSAFPFLFQNNEKSTSAEVINSLGDRVDISTPQVLADEEVDAVYNDTINMIANDHAQALSAHSGLSENRVFALLGI